MKLHQLCNCSSRLLEHITVTARETSIAYLGGLENRICAKLQTAQLMEQNVSMETVPDPTLVNVKLVGESA